MSWTLVAHLSELLALIVSVGAIGAVVGRPWRVVMRELRWVRIAIQLVAEKAGITPRELVESVDARIEQFIGERKAG